MTSGFGVEKVRPGDGARGLRAACHLLVAPAYGALLLPLVDGDMVAFPGHLDDVCDVHWTRQRGELRVASGDYGAVVRIWRGDGTPLREIRAHSGPFWSVRYSPRGDRLLSSSEDGTARIWRAP